MSLAGQPAVVAYIGLGSNLNDPIAQVRSARRDIARLNGIREIAFSSLYRSAPMGPADQPDFVNAVMAVMTTLPADTLLMHLQAIEAAHGRVRSGRRWGPRTLDLDLLLYDQAVIDSAILTVPHPGLARRAFVLYPLQEIAPDLQIVGQGSLAELVRRCPRNGLRRIERD